MSRNKTNQILTVYLRKGIVYLLITQIGESSGSQSWKSSLGLSFPVKCKNVASICWEYKAILLKGIPDGSCPSAKGCGDGKVIKKVNELYRIDNLKKNETLISNVGKHDKVMLNYNFSYLYHGIFVQHSFSFKFKLINVFHNRIKTYSLYFSKSQKFKKRCVSYFSVEKIGICSNFCKHFRKNLGNSN